MCCPSGAASVVRQQQTDLEGVVAAGGACLGAMRPKTCLQAPGRRGPASVSLLRCVISFCLLCFTPRSWLVSKGSNACFLKNWTKTSPIFLLAARTCSGRRRNSKLFPFLHLLHSPVLISEFARVFFAVVSPTELDTERNCSLGFVLSRLCLRFLLVLLVW